MAAASRIDPKDLYDPDFEIEVDRRVVPAATQSDVSRVTYFDALDTLDGFEIVLNNWDPATRSFKYSSGSLFDPGKELELRMGYSSAAVGLTTMIRGTITALRPRYPTGSYPEVTVSGVNKLWSLRDEQRSEVYLDKKDSDVARAVGSRLGFNVRTDAQARASEPVSPYLFQDNEYDIVFLFGRARANGYDLFLESDGKTLYFGPTSKISAPRLALPWSGTSLDFEAELQVLDQVAEVEVRAWNPEGATRKQQLMSATARRQRSQFEAAFKKRREVVVRQPVATQGEAQALARGYLARNVAAMVTGRGKLVGYPALRAGTVLELEGLDRRFGGEYFVTASRHVFDDEGYRTEFRCRKESPP